MTPSENSDFGLARSRAGARLVRCPLGRAFGGPGYRDYSPGYFAAFFLDPDGNNIEAVWYDPGKTK
jgi:catechol 2,3-dioxygenase-like lactoylglutathione lyase family enzyme